VSFEVFAASLKDEMLLLRPLRAGAAAESQAYVGPEIAGRWVVRAALKHRMGYAIVLHDAVSRRALLWHLTTEGKRTKRPEWSADDAREWVKGLAGLVDPNETPREFDEAAFEIRALLFDALIEDRTILSTLVEGFEVLVAGLHDAQTVEGRQGELARLLHRSLEGPRYIGSEYVKNRLYQGVDTALAAPDMHIFSFQMFSALIPAEVDGEPMLRMAKGRYRRMSAAYFPRDGVVVGDTTEWAGRINKLAALAAREILGMLVFQEDLTRFLRRPVRSLGLQSYEYHIGHYLWNELSSIENTRQAAQGLIQHVYVAESQAEHYGDLEQLYPEWRGHVTRAAMPADWLAPAFRDQEAVFRPAGKYISKSLADIVTAHSLRSETPLVAKLDALAQSLKGGVGAPLKILIGLRVENRCWLRQVDGYIALARRLADEGRRVVFVFDGHNVGGTARPILSATESIKDGPEEGGEAQALSIERGIVAQFREATAPLAAQIACADTLGLPVSASIAAGHWTDGFITHWGAGLAKYKWILNATGLVFTSNQASTKNDFLLYDRPVIREAAIGSDYLPQSLVTDTDDQSELMNGRNFSGNFDIDPDAFGAACAEWIDGKWPAPEPEMEGAGAIAGMRTALRRFLGRT
jgi:hypothetical protein